MTSALTRDRRDILLVRARQIEQAWDRHRDQPQLLAKVLGRHGEQVPDGEVASAAVAVMSMLADELETAVLDDLDREVPA